MTPSTILYEYSQKQEAKKENKKLIGLTAASLSLLGPLAYAAVTGTTVAAMLGVSGVALPLAAVMMPAVIGIGIAFKKGSNQLDNLKKATIQDILSQYGFSPDKKLNNNQAELVKNFIANAANLSEKKIKKIPTPSDLFQTYGNNSIQNFIHKLKNEEDNSIKPKKSFILGMTGAAISIVGISAASSPLLAIGGISVAAGMLLKIGKKLFNSPENKKSFIEDITNNNTNTVTPHRPNIGNFRDQFKSPSSSLFSKPR